MSAWKDQLLSEVDTSLAAIEAVRERALSGDRDAVEELDTLWRVRELRREMPKGMAKTERNKLYYQAAEYFAKVDAERRDSGEKQFGAKHLVHAAKQRFSEEVDPALFTERRAKRFIAGGRPTSLTDLLKS